MKTKLSIVILAICAMVCSSCVKKEYIECDNIQSVVINVNQKDWAYSNLSNNNYFYATVDMPEITKGVFQTGIVKMYRVYDFTSSNGSQMELPYVRLNELNVGGDQWVFYTETVDYEFQVGKITIYYTASDFDYELDETFVPEAMQFRCVIEE